MGAPAATLMLADAEMLAEAATYREIHRRISAGVELEDFIKPRSATASLFGESKKELFSGSGWVNVKKQSGLASKEDHLQTKVTPLAHS